MTNRTRAYNTTRQADVKQEDLRITAAVEAIERITQAMVIADAAGREALLPELIAATTERVEAICARTEKITQHFYGKR